MAVPKPAAWAEAGLPAVAYTAANEHDPLPPELAEALDDLHRARKEAREDGFPEPSDAAIGNVERLLRAAYEAWPGRYWVYPTQDGEVAIDSPGGFGRSVVLLCDSDGGALCLVNIGGRSSYREYPVAPDRFDKFLHNAFERSKK